MWVCKNLIICLKKLCLVAFAAFIARFFFMVLAGPALSQYKTVHETQ